MAFTSYWRKLKLDELLANDLWLSLHTADPTISGSHAFEVSGGGYARQPLTGVMSAADAVTGVSTNISVINFGTPSADWGTLRYVGIEDALTGGNMLWVGVSSFPRTVLSGNAFQLSPGQIVVFIA